MKKHRFGLSLILTVIILITMLVTLLIASLCITPLVGKGFIINRFSHRPLVPLPILIVFSMVVGAVVSAITSRIATRPIRKVIQAVNELADGDFSVRLDIKQPPEAAELTGSFNRMAEELGNTELLRMDFVNNFSHEFKTPIVSIKGFAEMLKYEDLSQEEKSEYLDLIIQESGRLAELSTNVLNLSRVEKQSILTNQARFNAGEQLRRTVILLQPRWESKNLDVSIDGEDIFLFGNEELMGQVWLNLLDNAVKFTPEGGRIAVAMDAGEGMARFCFTNSGPAIPPEKLARIFERFYQGDASHAAPGNGLGLTLARRVVELHGGTVTAASDEERGTAFTVLLPDTNK